MNQSQGEVFDVLAEWGPLPDTALVPIAQHFANLYHSSSGIRSRRAELSAKNLVKCVGVTVLPSGRKAQIWDVA